MSSLVLAGTAVFCFIAWLLFRVVRCIRRRKHPQEHSRRHSQTFEHTVYNHTRRASNYSFPLPARIPTYQHPHRAPYTYQQSSPTRSSSRRTTGMPEMRSTSRMSTFSNSSIAWPLTHQEQMRYVPNRTTSYNHHRSHSSAARSRDDTSSTSSGATINKPPSPTATTASGTPSEISVASTLVAVPLPAATNAQYVGARAGWSRNRPEDETAAGAGRR